MWWPPRSACNCTCVAIAIFSKAATQFTLHNQTLHQSKPLRWVAWLGVHSRIWKARHHFKVQQLNSVKAQEIYQTQTDSYPEHSPEHQYLLFLSYRWALDLLPLFLERSAISLELANVLHHCTFTMMAWKFLQRRRLAKEVIAKYLLQVEAVAGEVWIALTNRATKACFFFCKLYNIQFMLFSKIRTVSAHFVNNL